MQKILSFSVCGFPPETDTLCQLREENYTKGTSLWITGRDLVGRNFRYPQGFMNLKAVVFRIWN
jgi:hypothetical protein